MKRILRSSMILAASVATLIPIPQARAASANQKKSKETTQSTGRNYHAPVSLDNVAPATHVTVPAVSLSTPATTAIVFPPQLPSKAEPAVAGERFPWKTSIVTTTFWIGEQPAKNNPVPNHVSSWDEQWAKNYGGTDTPDKAQRVDFRPAAFEPGQNPFYVALPYNDIQSTGHKPEAEKVIPWFKEDFKGKGKTVLKGRWLAIRFKDRITYAQWEDCGPFRTDHSAYVFGNERPKANLNKGAGLDVSPAVRDYLGMNDTDVTDWKFVDFSEVPPGPWAKYGDNNTFVINKRLNEERVAALESGKPAPQ